MIEDRLTLKYDERFICVNFNPWAFRQEPNMLGPMLNALRDRLNEDPKRRFVDIAKRIGFIALNLATDELLKRFTASDVSIEKIGKVSQQYAEARGIVESQINQLRRTLQSEADRLKEKGSTLVFLIDDLDRCEPDQIIDLLESVKLFLDLKNVFVLLAIAKDVVDRGVSIKYRPFGFSDQNLSVISDEYLDKMVQLPLYLLPLAAAEVDYFIKAVRPASLTDDHVSLLQHIVARNPRKIKRVLNLLTVTEAIIAATPGLGLRSDLVTRLVVLRIQSPDLFTDVVRRPSLLLALELLYRGDLLLDKDLDFRARFGAEAQQVQDFAKNYYGRYDFLAPLFKDASFDSATGSLPAYLSMMGG